MNRAKWQRGVRAPRDSDSIPTSGVKRILHAIKHDLEKAMAAQANLKDGKNITYELPKEATNRPRLGS